MNKIEEIKQYAETIGEPSWFTKMRINTYQQLTNLKMPVFQKINYSSWPIHPQKPFLTNKIQNYQDKQDFDIIQINSETKKIRIPQKLQDQGVIICDLFQALKQYPELIQNYFMKLAVKADENYLTAEHLVNLNSGLVIYVPKNVKIKEPISILFEQAQSDYIHHLLLVADKNSEVNYLESISSNDNSKVANIIAEVVALENSHVKYSSIDQLSKTTTAYLNRRGYLAKDARIDWSLGMMSDGNIVGDFDSELVGDGSHAELKVIAISSGKQMQGIDTRVTNYGIGSIGHILQHGVILQESSLIFNGIGHIMKGARRSDAQQESRVLMLSSKARGDANPILLIDDNDVNAGHAASVGRIDQEQLYYLMSRGIPEIIAKRLVIRGFLGPVLTAIPEKTLQKKLIKVIEDKLIEAQ